MKNLERLRTLAEMVKSDEMARLGALNAEYAGILHQIEAHRAASTTVDPAFHQSGGYERWERWRQSEIARLNMALARLRVERESREQKTRTAVARVQVLEKLAARTGTRPADED